MKLIIQPIFETETDAARSLSIVIEGQYATVNAENAYAVFDVGDNTTSLSLGQAGNIPEGAEIIETAELERLRALDVVPPMTNAEFQS